MSYKRSSYDRKKYRKKLASRGEWRGSAFGFYYFNKEKKRIVRCGSTKMSRIWKRTYNRKIRRKLKQYISGGDFDKEAPNKRRESDRWDIT